jgi:hypothetical protein
MKTMAWLFSVLIFANDADLVTAAAGIKRIAIHKQLQSIGEYSSVINGIDK